MKAIQSNSYITFFAADADRWESVGLPIEEEDAIILALWRHYRGRPDTHALTLAAALLYNETIARTNAKMERYKSRSRAGKIGMVRRWHGADEAAASADKPKRTHAAFAKPTVEDVKAYCAEHQFKEIDPVQFVDFYESKGWVVGRSPMKDWKAAVRTWHKRSEDDGRAKGAASKPVGQVLRQNEKEDESAYEL